jgi:hypothetical protein
MTSVEEFIATRVSIETLGGKIAQSVKDNAVQHSKQQLETLRAMVCNDVQAIVEGRLSRLLAELETKVNAKVAKLPAKKTGEKKPRAKAVRASSKTPASTTE